MLLHFAKKSEKNGDTMFSVADSHSTMQTITSNHRVTYVTAGIIKSIWHISTTYTQTYLDTNIRGIDRHSNECLCMLPCENVNVIQMSSNNDDLRSLAKVHPLRYTTQHTAHIRAVGELALSSVSMCGISAASSDVLSLSVSLARWKSTGTAVNVRYFILVAC